MVQVIFTYDEESKKWIPTVKGISGSLEARQAFAAVVLTCQELQPTILDKCLVRDPIGGEYEIIPAV